MGRPSITVYLDHAATTPVADPVLSAMLPYMAKEFGNPSSIHSLGVRAARAVAQSREQVAALLGAHPEEIAFTSGGTEADNWALTAGMWAGRDRRPQRTRILVSATEHPAVMNSALFLQRRFGVEVNMLPVDEQGVVVLDHAAPAADVSMMVGNSVALVSVMLAGNEVGSLQPVAKIGAAARAAGALMHTDAVQVVGKLPVDVDVLEVDLLSLSAHKFYGPKGVGALYVRRGTEPETFMHGGSQESGRRAGTLNVAGIVGLGEACVLAEREMEEAARREAELVERMWSGLQARVARIVRNGHATERVPGILSVCIPGVEGESCVLRLSREGVVCSSGSACAAGSLEESHVLRAMGVAPELARGSLRLSVGRSTTEGDAERAVEAVARVVNGLRLLNPTWRDAEGGPGASAGAPGRPEEADG